MRHAARSLPQHARGQVYLAAEADCDCTRVKSEHYAADDGSCGAHDGAARDEGKRRHLCRP